MSKLDIGKDLISKKKMKRLLQEYEERKRLEEKQRKKEIRKRKRKEIRQRKKALKKKDYKKCQNCGRKVYNISPRTKIVTACGQCVAEIMQGTRRNKWYETKKRKQQNKSFYQQAHRQYLEQKAIQDAEEKEFMKRLRRSEEYSKMKRLSGLAQSRKWKRERNL